MIIIQILFYVEVLKMNSKLYFFKRFCFGIILTVGLFCSALSVRAEGLNVEVHSKDEIRNYISSSGSKNTFRNIYTVCRLTIRRTNSTAALIAREPAFTDYIILNSEAQ